jgi:single-strand DNA-binding protein
MPSLNRVQLIGRLGKDPETRYTNAGKNFCNFSLAVNRRWKNAQGVTQEATDWVNVTAWGPLGEFCQQHLGKGRLVFVEGRLRIDRVEQDGAVRYFTKVVATQMQMLDRKPDEPELAVEEAELSIE